ncbi:MAG TPA: AMP-binding protein [Tepidisphaeraceae bacterium]|jgi:acyl-CoA synthetase (AMP-forming)/AMP-acid ligase II
MALRLLDDLRTHARLRPDAPALLAVGGSADASLTFAELENRARELATILRDRIPLHSTVLLCYPSRQPYHAAFLGTLAAGDTVFPVSPDSARPELESAARRSSAAAAIVATELAPLIRPLFAQDDPLPAISRDAVLLTRPLWPARSGDGPALLLQSSGTTDRPKIVRRDGASLDAVSKAMVTSCRFTAGDHVLAAVPLCHSYGLEHGLLAPIAAGSCIHVCEKFDLPAVLAELRTGGITILPGVPFMFDMFARAADAAFPTLRRAYSAGGPLPRATFDAFLAKSGLRIGQVYGATEIGSVTFNDPNSPNFVPASVGTAMDDVEIRVLDADEPRVSKPLEPGQEGQVAIAAASMMSGYLDSDDAPFLDGHYLTGDLGRLDHRGVLTITGRLKLLIDVGGRKVNPAEVEAVLRQHPQVGACVVLPMRVSEAVCRLKAIVSPAQSGTTVAPEDLRAFARERLSAYKVPRVFEIRDAIPTSASGKVLRREVSAP